MFSPAGWLPLPNWSKAFSAYESLKQFRLRLVQRRFQFHRRMNGNHIGKPFSS
jgi:hypothetical protein